MNPCFTIAIVGRPNVGKSRLFNRLTKKRTSIVHDQPGVTRDIITDEIANGILLMDTGGVCFSDSNASDPMISSIENQVQLAISLADMIFFVVDALDGCLPLDREIAEKLRVSGKKVLVIANKIDRSANVYLADVFYDLGLGDPIPVSAEHGFGEEELSAIVENTTADFTFQSKEEQDNRTRICFVGGPNVGKSSIVNALLGEKRMIVSDVPGTTRDSVYCDMDFNSDSGSGKFRLLDTAGLRDNRKINSPVEYFSSIRTEKSIKESDVVFLVIDALKGITKNDKKLAHQVVELGKLLIPVVNKWDLAQDSFSKTKNNGIDGYDDLYDFTAKFEKAIGSELHAIPGSKVIFVSAKTGYNTASILEECLILQARATRNISTGFLNRMISKLMVANQPQVMTGRRFKVYYCVQTGILPYRFRIFCNQSSRLSDNYKKYLENGLRNELNLDGCSIFFELVEKEHRYKKPIPG
ncbi:MAG: ribosome biogenesis GTPase Der [Puniceicoccales bacterium]|jgi:GTP-binding protein|nr:ribosome biogenesis GTPase Der [Puniceicoccales bacterium]